MNKIIMPKSAIVRYRPHRGDRRNRLHRGVIYLPGTWIGMEVKVIRRKYYAAMIKRIHKLEGQLRRIQKNSKI